MNATPKAFEHYSNEKWSRDMKQQVCCRQWSLAGKYCTRLRSTWLHGRQASLDEAGRQLLLHCNHTLLQRNSPQLQQVLNVVEPLSHLLVFGSQSHKFGSGLQCKPRDEDDSGGRHHGTQTQLMTAMAMTIASNSSTRLSSTCVSTMRSRPRLRSICLQGSLQRAAMNATPTALEHQATKGSGDIKQQVLCRQ